MRFPPSLLTTFAVTGLALGAGAITAAAYARSSSPSAPSTPAANTPAAAAAPKGATPPSCHDEDGDSFGLGCARGNDCNDHDSAVHPGQAESCNMRDDDCNGIVDDSASCSAPAVNARARVYVPAGSFLMGSARGANDEKPEHRVSGLAFEMDRFEVTNARYRSCVDAGACAAPKMRTSHLRAGYFDDAQFADYPVIFVDHTQAETFCKAEGGRLPTEAEWERAARGVDAPRTFPWGDKAPDCSLANMGGAGSCIGDTDRIGRRPEGASPYGADDMAGNVWEWTSDWYEPDYYGKSPSADPKGPAAGRLKVMRGGCWVSGADSLRSTCRKAELPATWAYNVGFRCVYPAASSASKTTNATKGGDR